MKGVFENGVFSPIIDRNTVDPGQPVRNGSIRPVTTRRRYVNVLQGREPLCSK